MGKYTDAIRERLGLQPNRRANEIRARMGLPPLPPPEMQKPAPDPTPEAGKRGPAGVPTPRKHGESAR